MAIKSPNSVSNDIMKLNVHYYSWQLFRFLDLLEKKIKLKFRRVSDLTFF